MKIFAAGAVALTLLTCACTQKKGADNVIPLQEAEEQFAESLTEADTVGVLALGNAFMDSLQAGNVEYSISQLYMTDNNTLRPLNESEKDELRARFERFPVKSWKLDHYDMSIPSLNDLKYDYKYKDDPNAPGMKLMFNPIKTENGWVLMLKQSNQPAKDAKNALNPDTPVELPGDEADKEAAKAE